ncbi:MAG TPA: Cna B-type domain-containing protein, partial [Candidatus Pelethocola excrementipullorum]|nr:Cna B-type domain-containing protein [Candidatus Pelethocola excrementipullorum]
RPSQLSVGLYADNVLVETKELTGTGDTWSYTWEDLPKYQNGKKIVYTAAEIGTITDYSQKSKATADDVTTIVNAHTPGEISKTVKKIWNDSDNQDGFRPEYIEVQLYAEKNGAPEAAGSPVRLDEGNDWTYTWNGLTQKDGGVDIVYTVEEVTNAPNYTQAQIDQTQEPVTITNSHTPELTSHTIEKQWEDGENQDGLRPTQLEVALYADDVLLDTIELTGTDNTWSYTWEDLPKYQNGNEIVYTAAEIGTVDNYTQSSWDTVGEVTAIVNSHTPEITSHTIEKQWDDNGNQDGTRPSQLEIGLYADNALINTYELTGTGDTWSYTWEDLPKYQNGNEIIYTAAEIGTVEDYSQSAHETIGNITTIVNAHTPGVTSKTVKKAWDDNGNQDGIRPEYVEVQLYAEKTVNGVSVKEEVESPIRLDGDNTWTHTWNNLPQKNEGTDILYTVEEVTEVSGYTQATIDQNQEPVVVTNVHTPEVIEKTVEKVWKDNDNKDQKRPNSIQVQLYADGVALGEPVTLSEGDNWTYTIDSLAKYKNGDEITYTIKEINIPTDYQSSSTVEGDKTTITNELKQSGGKKPPKWTALENPTHKNNTSKNGTVKTGDTTNIVIPVLLLIASAAVGVVLISRKRNHRPMK